MATPLLCLGEAIVDLVCERPVSGICAADQFRPHFGGAVANAAVSASRHGATVALAGGAGHDAWGEWLWDRLAAESVDMRWFKLVGDLRTPIAFVTVDDRGEPDFAIYGEGIEATVEAVAPQLGAAIDASGGFFFSSNTLVGPVERKLTMDAREQALRLGRAVCFDPNLRLPRWPSTEDAVAAAKACVPGATLVRANRVEAELMTDRVDPVDAADALVEMGAQAAVVTRGAGGAVLRGAAEADVPGVPARVVNTTGAGDVLTGTLLAALQRARYDPDALAPALVHAVEDSARATERWGALS
jgi:sugar/nucleoside kinase (ribokinase family)